MRRLHPSLAESHILHVGPSDDEFVSDLAHETILALLVQGRNATGGATLI
jgi:hypothetical protein